MPATFSVKCPECRATLTSRKPIPGGKLLTCPKCDVMFAAPQPPEDDIVEDVEVLDDDGDVVEDVEVVDESPARKSKRPVAVKSGAANLGFEVVEDDEDDDDPGPRRPQFRSKSKSSGKMGLIIGGAVGGGLLLGGGAFLLWWLLHGAGENPLAFVPSNAPIVGGVDFKGLMDSSLGPNLAPFLGSPAMPFSKLTSTTNTSMNDGIERLVFGGTLGSTPGFTVAVRTARALDTDKLAAAFPGSTKSTVGGKSVLRLPPTGGPTAMFVAGKRTAVFSDLSDDQLGRVASNSGRSSALSSDASTIADHFNKATIWAVITPDDSMRSGMNTALAANPATKAMAGQLQSAKGFGISIGLASGDVELRIGMLCADANAAKQVMDQMKEANEKSKNDPAAKLLMLAMPASVKNLQTEIESSTQYSTDGAMAFMTCRANMATVKFVFEEMKDKLPGLGNPAGGGMNRRGMQ